MIPSGEHLRPQLGGEVMDSCDPDARGNSSLAAYTTFTSTQRLLVRDVGKSGDGTDGTRRPNHPGLGRPRWPGVGVVLTQIQSPGSTEARPSVQDQDSQTRARPELTLWPP